MSERIVSQPSSAKYRENWERIWGKREKPQEPITISGMQVITDETLPKNYIELRDIQNRWPKWVYTTVSRNLEKWAERQEDRCGTD
jgi:hypothetical protein